MPIAAAGTIPMRGSETSRKGWHRNPRLEVIPARKFRAYFATIASVLGANNRLLRAYLGHAPEDVPGSHYRAIGVDDFNSSSGLMNGWRTLPEILASKGKIKQLSGNGLEEEPKECVNAQF
jgi:hypothetical protein